MSGRIADGRRIASAWALSVAAHAAVVGAGALLVARSLTARPIAIAQSSSSPSPDHDETIEIELPVITDGTLAGQTVAPPDIQAPLARGGGEAAPRPDSGALGRGGTDTAEQAALNLADRDDGLFLSPEVRSRLDRSQIQRIHSAEHRASREDMRASREPMELTFIASGRRGGRAERRAQSNVDPSLGARERGAPTRVGGALGAAQATGIERGTEPSVADAATPPASPRVAGGPIEGAERASAGLGVRDGTAGADHRDSAAIDFARPMVAEGTPSIPASVAGRPNDTIDSEQEVATALQALLHASTAGGAPGAGPGGQSGPGPTGSGGVAGPGSRSRALGTGAGARLDNDPLDRRRSLYMRQVMAKVNPLWQSAFPAWAAAEGLQGTVIVAFVIRADGSVAGASIARPSGIAEFDENCRRAVLRGAPYPPLPPELGTSFRWSMPFEARNPAVLPRRGAPP